MIYVYDLLMDKELKTITRFGATYKLEQKFRMGNKMFYSYISSGMEKILVVPAFVKLYKSVESFVNNLPKNNSLDYYRKQLEKSINKSLTSEEFPSEESEDGTMTVFEAVYKNDIKVSFEYLDRRLRLCPSFEIVDNNIFGSGIVVSMEEEEEE